jgi:hypothetical protein
LAYVESRKCIGTTEKYPKETVKTLTMGDLPYKSVHLVTKKEFETMKDDTLEVVEARHHLIGYTGHLHAKQVRLEDPSYHLLAFLFKIVGTYFKVKTAGEIKAQKLHPRIYLYPIESDL